MINGSLGKFGQIHMLMLRLISDWVFVEYVIDMHKTHPSICYRSLGKKISIEKIIKSIEIAHSRTNSRRNFFIGERRNMDLETQAFCYRLFNYNRKGGLKDNWTIVVVAQALCLMNSNDSKPIRNVEMIFKKISGEPEEDDSTNDCTICLVPKDELVPCFTCSMRICMKCLRTAKITACPVCNSMMRFQNDTVTFDFSRVLLFKERAFFHLLKTRENMTDITDKMLCAPVDRAALYDMVSGRLQCIKYLVWIFLFF